MKVKHLSEEEQERVWGGVMKSFATNRESSPRYSILQFTIKPMYKFAIALLLFVFSAGTVYASDSAKPGDTLFPLDRAWENIRLVFSSGEKKDELKVKFAFEREQEFNQILSENSDNATSTSETATTTKETSQNARVSNAFGVALDYLVRVQADLEAKGNTNAVAAVAAVIARLNAQTEGLSERVKLEIEQERNKLELKLKSEGTKIEIKIEDDGKVKVEREDGEDDEDESHERGVTEIKARIIGGTAFVEVEINDRKESLTVDSTDREVIITAIAEAYGLDQVEVAAMIEIERSSESDDAEDGDHSDSSRNDETGVEQSAVKKIEARIEGGVTAVKTEFSDGTKEEFTLTQTTQVEIISALAARYDEDIVTISTLLKLELED